MTLRDYYDGKSEKDFKRIDECSCYNSNFYIGFRREGKVVNDILYAESDDDNKTDWYMVYGDCCAFIGQDYGDGIQVEF